MVVPYSKELLMFKKVTDEIASKPKFYTALLAAHLFITSLTWRDLRGRRADQVRGSKSLWKVAAAANMSNSLVYFVIGRKKID
jgi:hypothetical protein